ncbi:hypothetical protein UFOVP266_54 [uncultured Caudovirales phage]|uniref:C1q domain containing protein n=1 Tax=uncultured Caudovirales phage TaxID=2100421 RepID=A0A6J5LMZ1_9CAUD|nr:hypothetical protein UFOVP266_54 [uncultured Caudovirales phage]
MSSIAISGDTSGAVTLSVPAVAGTNTVTVAAQTGTLNAAGPAFHVETAGSQTFTSGTVTKVTFSIEVFDTNNNFASSTFTPTVAGYYQINAVFWFGAGTTATDANANIYKNGAFYSQARAAAYSGTAASCSISDVVYCNGTTDFIELYGRAAGTGTLTANANMFFSGCLIRGA